MMVDHAREMTVKKSCKHGRYGSFEHLLFLLVFWTGQQSPSGSPAMIRRMVNRAPAEHRRSFPDSARTQQLLEEYYDGYGSSSTAGGSTSGYGSGG